MYLTFGSARARSTSTEPLEGAQSVPVQGAERGGCEVPDRRQTNSIGPPEALTLGGRRSIGKVRTFETV